MQHRIVACGFVLGLSTALPADAADFCAHDPFELQAALTASQANGEDDTILVLTGDYPLNAGLVFVSSEAHSLDLFGSIDDCAVPHPDLAGAGTVLFFEDQDVVKSLQEQFPLYADAFPAFSEQSGGMAQFAVWTALAEHGIGASLQHYAPLVDEAVQKEWHVPKSWKLRAQMPFGSNEQPFPEKSFMNDNDRFKVYS